MELWPGAGSPHPYSAAVRLPSPAVPPTSLCPPYLPGAHVPRALRDTLGATSRQGVRRGPVDCPGADRLQGPPRCVCACEHAHRLSSSPARPPSRPGAHASRALRHTLGAAARQGVRHGSMECSGAPDRLLEPQRFVCACKHAHWLSSRLSSVGPSSPGRWPRPLPPEALRPGLGGAMRAPPLQLAAQLHARCTSRLEGRLVWRCPRVAQRVRSRGPRPAEGVLRVRLGLLRHVDDARKGRRETVADFFLPAHTTLAARSPHWREERL